MASPGISPSAPAPNALYRWASLRTELLWAYDGAILPENRHRVLDHREGYWAWLLRRGTVQFTDGKKRKWIARAGQWIISSQGRIEQEFSKDAALLSLHFRCQWPTGESAFAERECLICEGKDFPQLDRHGVALHELIQRHFPDVRIFLSAQLAQHAVFFSLQQRFLQWLTVFFDVMLQGGSTFARTGEGNERLLKAADILHETTLDGVFPFVRLQKETGLKRAGLDRLFWREFGKTPREYWEQLRDEAARGSLSATELLIKEVGFHLGFRQTSHFTKWFLRRSGMTPSDYRAETALKRKIGDI